MEKKKVATIDEYIAQFDPEARERMNRLRALIMTIVPDAQEKMSWQMPTFYRNGNIVHFAGHKNHIGLYPGPDAIEYFAEELAGYKTSKGAMQLPNSKPLPMELIEKLVRHSAQLNAKRS